MHRAGASPAWLLAAIGNALAAEGARVASSLAARSGRRNTGAATFRLGGAVFGERCRYGLRSHAERTGNTRNCRHGKKSPEFGTKNDAQKDAEAPTPGFPCSTRGTESRRCDANLDMAGTRRSHSSSHQYNEVEPRVTEIQSPRQPGLPGRRGCLCRRQSGMARVRGRSRPHQIHQKPKTGCGRGLQQETLYEQLVDSVSPYSRKARQAAQPTSKRYQSLHEPCLVGNRNPDPAESCNCFTRREI